MSCLRRVGVEVVERHEPVWDGERRAFEQGARGALRLVRAQARLRRGRPRGPFDAIIVGYPGHLDLGAARRAAQGAPVVFNPLVSLVDTFVTDRGRFRARSAAARLLAALDRRALRSADLVVADTQASADFLVELASLDPARVAVCYVGAEERLFRPGWQPSEGAPCLFVGKLIPLHGVRTIVAAAALAPELRFRIVGSGQEDDALAGAPANVEHLPWVEYDQLPGELHAAACALGVFGQSAKARRVIPNKAFQALACGTPLVTADTPAVRELLVDGESALLIPPGDPKALADALRRLTTDAGLAERLSGEGRRMYRTVASEEALGHRWRGLLEGLRR